MTEGESRPDIPKFVAALGTRVPMLAIRLGVSYLRLKGRANKASKAFVSELERGGMPSEHAKRLGAAYASDVSLRKFMRQTGAGGIQNVRLR